MRYGILTVTRCLAAAFLFFMVSGTPIFAEEFSGVGIVLTSYETVVVHPETGQTALKPPAYEYFVSPLHDSPAERAGMPELAKLIAVDGRDVEDMDPGMVVARIRGLIGSTVVLRVIVEEERSGVFSRYIREYTLTRGHIVAPDRPGKNE